MRNLDLLNIDALGGRAADVRRALGAHRRSRARRSRCSALVFVALGTVLFVAEQRRAADAGAQPALRAPRRPAERAALEAAAEALLARGAHGSFGAFPGFFALRGRGRCSWRSRCCAAACSPAGWRWVGIAGTAILIVYTVAITFAPGVGRLVMAIAVPGGLLMLAWKSMVARGLLRLGDFLVPRRRPYRGECADLRHAFR